MYTVRFFMKCMHVCASQTTYLFFTKLQIEPDFPCLADEIAKPSTDMNIKVAAFTVNEKSIRLQLTHCVLGNLHALFFKINFFQKFIQEYDQSVKQFGQRSGLKFCRAWSWSKLFEKFICRPHK